MGLQNRAKGEDMRIVIEEFGGAVVYAIAGGGMLGIFIYLLESLLGI